MGQTYFVVVIKIYKERYQGILSLSQKIYMNKILDRFNIKDFDSYCEG